MSGQHIWGLLLIRLLMLWLYCRSWDQLSNACSSSLHWAFEASLTSKCEHSAISFQESWDTTFEHALYFGSHNRYATYVWEGNRLHKSAFWPSWLCYTEELHALTALTYYVIDRAVNLAWQAIWLADRAHGPTKLCKLHLSASDQAHWYCLNDILYSLEGIVLILVLLGMSFNATLSLFALERPSALHCTYHADSVLIILACSGIWNGEGVLQMSDVNSDNLSSR